MTARAFWTVAAGQGELRTETLAGREGMVLRTLASGVSRGTEALVFAGRVPESQYDTMRAPMMGGAFPFPVKYGYSAVAETPERRRVFVLHPHQDRMVVDAGAVHRGAGRGADAIAPCSPPTWRPRSTLSGTPRPWRASGCSSSAPASSAC